MKTIYTVLLVATLIGCGQKAGQQKATSDKPTPSKATQIKYSGGDGSSFDRAVGIVGAVDSQDGVDAEYEWIRAHFVGAKVLGQSLESSDGKRYDVIRIVAGDGMEKQIYFDISKFFGK